VLGLTRPSELALVESIDAAVYEALVARRARRVPLQHLVGSVGFRWIELLVGPGVFVPRPETESVAQWAIDHAPPSPLVVDLCTGSGTLALSIANEVPGATVHAVELDLVAVQWAQRNADARAAAGDPRVTVHQGGVVDALPELDGTVDLVISNPPYVGLDEAHLSQPEVIDHDPSVALFAGPDGLDVIREVERTAHRLLKPGGLVVVEHSDRQGASAPAVFAHGWIEVQDHRDLTGRDRYVTARKRAHQ
jgi:release factor glutamine methyltransferase